MERNLHRRVETGFPIEKSSMVKRILDELEHYLDDSWQSWILQSDGSYQQQQIDTESSVQQQLLDKLAQ